ncbi:hypothetical protein BFW01_g10490 [Lasiodiplodia theobromae]|uniref:Uncharacterized protein n=2 Tax=Lasiodiplodia TaxID=66739 RepID=A0A5N5DF66_9PEZI|nr:uncharacterized protein LTHEOB_6604 [Lasiodiplodia theobromae]KAB2576459.1 hypothetical protein DBV05_g4900 [Lasiodiplodia theobromae]KAF4543938.1 hypothetical protein LTHEOB_6604 [Lasiodiplodia theobromae]KAF9629287.1 hypothetical protein BFW01_g10490 [Lasiodiplodia theobromae]KAK0664129.1 hypothetical protein DIS24_g596 [Lasiodiplodia hormozganensis]
MGECTAEDKRECYVPMPSLGHELGILFGFLALMLVCMLSYGVMWQVGNRRSLRKEEERIAALRAAGHLKDEKSSTESNAAANRA